MIPMPHTEVHWNADPSDDAGDWREGYTFGCEYVNDSHGGRLFYYILATGNDQTLVVRMHERHVTKVLHEPLKV